MDSGSPLLFRFENRITPRQAVLGLVCALDVRADVYPEALDGDLARLIEQRRQPLTPGEDQLREEVRNLLRNGKYRPTGRGKPASEYLIRAAGEEGTFPRINAPVDVCNYVSLKTLLPISLWDLDLAGTTAFRFQTGRAGESYVFNQGGQEIDVEDLICGFRIDPASGADTPIVNPVKDSLATKTTDDTTAVAAAVYAPAERVSREQMEEVCAMFAALLGGCGPSPRTGYGVAGPGEDRRISL